MYKIKFIFKLFQRLKILLILNILRANNTFSIFEKKKNNERVCYGVIYESIIGNDLTDPSFWRSYFIVIKSYHNKLFLNNFFKFCLNVKVL